MRKYMLTGVILLLLGVCVSSCNKTSPAFNRENIKATWSAPSQNYFYKFDENQGLIIYGEQLSEDGNCKWGASNKIYYVVYCCSLEIVGNATGFFGIPTSAGIDFAYDISKQKDSLLIITPTKYNINLTPVEPGYTELQMNKLPSNYAVTDSISGIWEVFSKNGAAYNEFRFQFDKTGSMVYYFKDSEGAWKERRVINDENDYYNKYSDFLALTLYDNSTLGTADKWDVSCFNIDSLSPSSRILDITSETFGSFHLEKIE